MKLSIIVPVYNVEAWLERCLTSLLSIGLHSSDYEIIAVNDGSSDQSLRVLTEFAQNHQKEAPRVEIVNQENGGLSAARNKGLLMANGDYVWFVDSDDYIEAAHVKTLVEQCVNYDLDVLCFGLQLAYDDGNIIPYSIKDLSNGCVLNGADFITLVEMPPAAWCALYKREFLYNNKLHFMERIIHEDQEFTPRAYYFAERIMYNPVVIYDYVQREGSIMKNGSQNEKRAKDLLKVADSLFEFTCKHVKKDGNAYNVMMNKIAFAFGQSLRYCTSTLSVSEYESKAYYPLAINDLQGHKEKLKYQLINRSVRLYLIVYRLIHCFK